MQNIRRSPAAAAELHFAARPSNLSVCLLAMGQKQPLEAQLFFTHARLSQGLEHPPFAALKRTLGRL